MPPRRDLPTTLGLIEQALFPSTPAVRLGRFEIVEPLGRGGMGVVYLAHDPQLKRKVAIKVHRDRRREAGGARLQREAESLARLRHRNVVSVHEVGRTDDGDVFVVMEYLPGPTLRAWIAREHPPVDRILDVFVRCARGLAAAHDEGLVHRDFKPDNVIVDLDGEPRILDFGLAHADDGERQPTHDDEADADGYGAAIGPHPTRTGALVGTPRYMAPELWDGDPPTPRTDQFAIAVALYECIAGRAPFSERRFDPPARPRALSRRAWAAVRRALDPLPAQRFASIDAFADALERARRPRRVRPIVAGIAGGIALAAGWVVARPSPPHAAEATSSLAPSPCAVGTELLDSAPGSAWTLAPGRARFTTEGLELALRPDARSYAAAILDVPMSFADRSVEFRLGRHFRRDTSHEVFLTLRKDGDDAVSVLVWSGEWVFPMAPNTHGLALPIDRTRDLWFRIQVEDQATLPDLVTFEFSPDGQRWTPIARVESSVSQARIEIGVGSHDPVARPDAVVVRSVRCTELRPVAPMAAERDRARVESPITAP